MLNKPFITIRLTYFPLILELVEDFNMFRSWNCSSSFSPPLKILLYFPGLAHMLHHDLGGLSGGWSPPHPLLWVLTTSWISLMDRIGLVLQLCAMAGASHLPKGSVRAWAQSHAALCLSRSTEFSSLYTKVIHVMALTISKSCPLQLKTVMRYMFKCSLSPRQWRQ